MANSEYEPINGLKAPSTGSSTMINLGDRAGIAPVVEASPSHPLEIADS
jgi:hypothetical protein